MRRASFRLAMALSIAVCALTAMVAPVSAQPGDVWVDDNYCDGYANDGHTWGYDAFDSIGAGVGAVATGGTVHVAAGTYDESVTIGKSLTLRGANAGLSAGADPETRGDESIVNGQITIQVSDVRVNGFRINGDGAVGIFINGSTSGHTISNNRFAGPGSGESGKFGVIFGYHTNNIDIIDNEFANWHGSVYVNPSGNNALSITGNNFHDNNVGIGSDGLNNVTIQHNNFTNNNEGWGYGDLEDYNNNAHNLDAHNNNFIGNAVAISNKTDLGTVPDLIDATGNWWGDPSGPLDDSPGPPQYNPTGQGDPVTDWVTYDPYLTEESGGVSSGGGCFIATAAYGSYMDSRVDTLRAFRDSRMESNTVGSAFVSAYYRLSPPVAGFIDGHPALKPAVRAALLPAVGISEAGVSTCLSAKLAMAGSILLLSALAVARLRRKAVQKGS